MTVMSMRPKACNVMHNGLHELALSYDGGTTWALTTRRGEIPCDMDDWFRIYDWDGVRPVERSNASHDCAIGETPVAQAVNTQSQPSHSIGDNKS
jgi:hypothetical protein